MRHGKKNDRVYDVRYNLWSHTLSEFDEFVFRFGKIFKKKQVSEIRVAQLQITNSSIS